MPSDLPAELVIPPAYIGNKMEVEDWQPAAITLRSRNSYYDVFPRLETPAGTRAIKDFYSIIQSCSTSHLTLTIVPPGIFDSLLMTLGEVELFALDLGMEMEIKGWKCSYRGSTLTFKKKKETHKLINLWGFFNLDEETFPSDIDIVNTMVRLLFYVYDSHKISFSNLSSPVAVSRHLMLQTAYYEFPSRRMDRDLLNDFYQACHGGRQESTGIGTSIVYNYDMRNAHLGILNNLVSIRRNRYVKDFPYDPEASYGAYLIRAEIPRMAMCPLPVELNNWTADIVYPYGGITGWYAKPFINLLNELRIPYQVIKSHQFFPVFERRPPFEELVDRIRNIMTYSPSVINVKSLYYGIAGSTIHWRWAVDNPETGELVPRSFNVFNPLIYSHVLAEQSVRVFKEVNRSTPVAIRADAVSTRSPLKTTLRPEDSGAMTFITPLFKVFPNGKGGEWAGLLNSFRDSDHLEYVRESYPTVKKSLASHHPLGRKATVRFSIYPNHGKRLGARPTKIGGLLSGWYPSIPVEIQT